MASTQPANEVFWYLPEHLTDAQAAALQAFRSRLSSEGLLLAGQDSDTTLLRFLKARQWQLGPATTMYSNMVAWRNEAQVDKLYSALDFPELDQLLVPYPHFYHKTDRFGRPVYIELLGRVDCGKILEVADFDRVIQYHIWTWERLQCQLMPACSTLAGKPIIGCTVIIDLAGLSMRSFSLAAKRLMTAIMKIDQLYYPEHLGTMFLINTPCIFTAIWSVISPMLEERTRKKITVLGSKYLDALSAVIPLENLPTMFGGKSVCKGVCQTEGPWMAVEPCQSNSWLPVGPSGHAAYHTHLASSTPEQAKLHAAVAGGAVTALRALKLSGGAGVSSSSSLATSLNSSGSMSSNSIATDVSSSVGLGAGRSCSLATDASVLSSTRGGLDDDADAAVASCSSPVAACVFVDPVPDAAPAALKQQMLSGQ